MWPGVHSGFHEKGAHANGNHAGPAPKPTPAGEARNGHSHPPAAAPKPAPKKVVVPPVPSQVELDPEFREVFLADATDLFERIEAQVLDLGQPGPQAERLRELGRTLHTFKGAAGAVGLTEVGDLVHAVEDRT